MGHQIRGYCGQIVGKAFIGLDVGSVVFVGLICTFAEDAMAGIENNSPGSFFYRFAQLRVLDIYESF